jgi:hypothetical protein
MQNKKQNSNMSSGDVRNVLDVNAKNLPITYTDDHIAGLWEGDGSFNLLLHSGKYGKSLANGRRFKPRFILSQTEFFGYLVSVQNYLQEEHDITSSIQTFGGKHGDNLYIENWGNCRKFLNILKKCNVIGPKRFLVENISEMYTQVFEQNKHNTQEGMLLLLDFRESILKDFNIAKSTAEYELACGFSINSSKNKWLPFFKKVMKRVSVIRREQKISIESGPSAVTPEYLAGFTAAEGYWFISVQLPPLSKSGKPKAPILVFRLVYKVYLTERFTLKLIAHRLGLLNPKISRVKNKKSFILVINKVEQLDNIIIPFFVNASFDFHMTKHKQFQLFIEFRQLVLRGEHKTKEGYCSLIKRLFETPYRNNHKSRKFTKDQYLAWAEENWKFNPNLVGDRDTDFNLSSSEIDNEFIEEVWSN